MTQVPVSDGKYADIGASEIIEEIVAVTTTGADGGASGSGTSHVLHGFLLDVYLDYHASCPATADVTVAYTTKGGNIVVVSNNATDGLYAPRKQVCDSVGAAVSGVYDRWPLNQALTVSVAQANALTNCVVASIRYLR